MMKIARNINVRDRDSPDLLLHIFLVVMVGILLYPLLL